MEENATDNARIEAGRVLFGRYRILAHLGTGGMGEVYRALDEQTGREAALKSLSFHGAAPDENEKAVKRFRNEFLVMQQLQHENIVQAYELHESEHGELFISMELVEGTNLDELIHESEERFSFRDNLRLLLQIAEGLHFAHQQGIIHRDLKPANILVAADGTAKLADFGLARRVAGQMELSQSSTRIGTAYYMPPEQHRGQNLDARSDIYSFGILAYELFSKRRPFDADTPFMIFVQHVTRSIPSLHAEDREIPSWVDTMIEICTEKEPQHRYPNMGQIVDLLKAHIDPKPKRRPWFSGTFFTVSK